MTDKRKIYVLGITSLNEDEDEALQDLGEGIYLAGHQLVTAKGVAGVAQATAVGFDRAGGTTEYITTGTVPDSRDVLIISDITFQHRITTRVPDAEKRGWLFIPSHRIHDFHLDLLRALAAKDIHLPKYGGGVGGDLTPR